MRVPFSPSTLAVGKTLQKDILQKIDLRSSLTIYAALIKLYYFKIKSKVISAIKKLLYYTLYIRRAK